jgi:hypothetical protein
VKSNSISNQTHLLYISGQGTTDVKINDEVPKEISLGQNYPNPFNPNTKIVYSLSSPTYVSLEVFDALGRSIQKLVEGYSNAGKHEIIFDGKGYSSGVYYYQLRFGKNIITKKMLLIK